MTHVLVSYWRAARTADDKWGTDHCGTFPAATRDRARHMAEHLARAYASREGWAAVTWCAIEAPAEWAGEVRYDVRADAATWIPA